MVKKVRRNKTLDDSLIRQEDHIEQRRRVEKLRIDAEPLIISPQDRHNIQSEKSEARALRVSGKVKNYYPPVAKSNESMGEMKERLSRAWKKNG